MVPPHSLPDLEPPEVIVTVPDALRAYCWRGVHVLIWEAAPTVNAVKALTAALLRHGMERDHVTTSMVLIVTRDAVTAPSEAARDELIAMQQREPITAMAVMIEHDGFYASGVRAGITNVSLATQQRTAMRTAQSLQEIADWLADVHTPPTGPRLRPSELLSALEGLRHGRVARAV